MPPPDTPEQVDELHAAGWYPSVELKGAQAVLLSEGNTLNRQMIKDIYGTSSKQAQEELARREHDAQVREHRDWMIGVLEAGAAYADEQARRREGDRLVSQLERELSRR